MYRMENLETKTTKTDGFERGDNSTSSTLLAWLRSESWLRQLPKVDVSDGHELSEDVKDLDLVRVEMVDISARVNVVVRAVENQEPT